MQKFTDFSLQLTYPPNPIRQLDNSLRPDEQAGFNRYFGANTDGGVNCNGCHTLSGAAGFFGGDGNSSEEGETQECAALNGKDGSDGKKFIGKSCPPPPSCPLP